MIIDIEKLGDKGIFVRSSYHATKAEPDKGIFHKSMRVESVYELYFDSKVQRDIEYSKLKYTKGRQCDG